MEGNFGGPSPFSSILPLGVEVPLRVQPHPLSYHSLAAEVAPGGEGSSVGTHGGPDRSVPNRWHGREVGD
jgi:hypothetical protein